MEKQWRENLERKIENQILRIAEIENKKRKLDDTVAKLYTDLAKNQKLLKQGPEVPMRKKELTVSESDRQEILMRSTSFFNK